MISFEELLPLFISNPLDAIEKSQQLICSTTSFNSYEEFYSYHQQHPHMSTCQKEWSDPQMAIHCFDCANSPQSCICLQCFLNGNHKGHDYIIRASSTGNCDCGDLSFWKRSGFCTEHAGVEEDSHPENYLDDKLKTVLTDIVFKAAFSSITELKENEDTKISLIVQFLSSFLLLGDGFRRLISISLTEKVDVKAIFYDTFNRSTDFNQRLKQLLSGLINDDVFRCRISIIIYQFVIDKLLPIDFDSPLHENKVYDIWKHFWFHFFSRRPLEFNISNQNWDWVSFTLQFSTFMKNYFSLVGTLPLNYNIPDYMTEVTINIPRAYRSQTIEQTQRLFDEMFTKVFHCGSEEKNNDGIVVASFSDSNDEEYYLSLHSFKTTFFYIIDCFKLKKNLKLDKLFEEFDRSVDISSIFCIGKNTVGDSNENENDKFISKFIQKVNKEGKEVNDKYYKSFHNGAAFFHSHPLYESLLHLFRTDNINRVKIAQILSTKKYQSLRVQLGIITLKNILSFTCIHQSLTPQNNDSLKIFTQIFLRPSCLDYSIPLYFPIFQLLLGLQCNDKNVTDEFSLKEFFAFEMAREIGLFDNFESEDYSDEAIPPLQKQMIFSVLYIAILVVLERNLFNFSPYNFIEEQIIMALKGGVSQLDDLNKSYASDIDTHFRQTLIKILSNVATTSRNSEKNDDDDTKESSFYLKKDIEWKSITCLNPFNSQKVILEKEISKNPNVLIKIPDFEPEENYFFHPPRRYQPTNSIDEYEIDATGLNIHLKEFLFTPTILAVAYHTLRSSSEESIQKVSLNDHLAMIVLTLISKFANEIDEKEDEQTTTSFTESTVIQYDSTLVDLISKLKRTVFNFNIDSNDNSATIKNTLNRKSFITFLNVKIESNQKAKSFIDLLLEKGEIGQNVLNQMSIDISQYGIKAVNSELSQAQIKKKRAKKLKEEIMNQYKSAISNCNYAELDQLDGTPLSSTTIGDACSICSTIKNDEILSYSVYMYRTKIPFAFDKPPLIKYNLKYETPVDDDMDDMIFKDSELNEDDEDDDDDDEPSPEKLQERLQSLRNETNPAIFYFMQHQILSDYSRRLQEYENKKIKKQYILRMKAKKEELKNYEDNQKILSDTERRITAGNNFVVQFSTCQHPVHPSCINDKNFHCPIDRSLRNGFLPAIDGIENEKIFKDYEHCHTVTKDSLTEEMQESLGNFIRLYSDLFTNTDINVELVKSISSLISTYEIRLRTLPDCLDSAKTKLLSRNLFLTAWYAYRMAGKPEMHLFNDTVTLVESRLTTFQNFIKRLIECDDLVSFENNSDYTEHTKEVFIGIVSSFINNPSYFSTDPIRRQKEIYLFLKRVCLSDYFLLNSNKVSRENDFSNLLDWDEILSVSYLSEYYNVKLDDLINNENGSEFEFKPFVFSKMPKEFLHFALKPFNYHVDYTHQYILFNIIDYNYLIKHHDDFEDVVVDEDEELKKNQDNVVMFDRETASVGTILCSKYSRYVYPSVFLSIGKASSQVIIVNGDEIATLKSFYFDRFGCEELGYARGMPLFLNEDKYERTIDEILSGDFSFYFNS